MHIYTLSLSGRLKKKSHILDNGRTIEKPIPIVTFDRDGTIGSTNDTLSIAAHSDLT